MERRIHNHLDARTGLLVRDVVELALDALRVGATPTRVSDEIVLTGDGGPAHDPSTVEVFLSADRTLVQRHVTSGGAMRRLTIVERRGHRPDPMPTDPAAAAILLETWLAEATARNGAARDGAYGRAREEMESALIGAASREADWTSACLSPASANSRPTIRLSNEDSVGWFGPAGEPPFRGAMSPALLTAASAERDTLHLTTERQTSHPGSMVVFGPPPRIQVRSADITPMLRLHAIRRALARGDELTGA